MTGEFSPWGALALLLLAALALFHRPLGCLLRLAVRSSVGLAVLALFFLFLYGLGRRNFCKIVEENI